MNRTIAVARLYTVNRWSWLYTPLIVFTGSFALTWGILALVARFAGDPDEAGSFVASSISLVSYVVGVSVVAGTRMFPFGFSLGLTRATFFRGTLLAGLTCSVAMATFMTIGSALERATDFWGVRLPYFTLSVFNTESLAVIFFGYLTVMLGAFATGLCLCLIFKRWGFVGLFGIIVVVALALTVFIAWMIIAGTGPDLLTWITDQSIWLGIATALAGALLLLGISRWAISRAVP